MIIFKPILKDRARGFVRDLPGSGQGSAASFCEHGNAILGRTDPKRHNISVCSNRFERVKIILQNNIYNL
jgi:hypothetical protein